MYNTYERIKNMSYDLDHITHECACPCGKGKIIYGSGTNDWNQVKDGMIEISCPECCKKYRFKFGGLLPIDYPEYKGDENAKKIMKELGYKITNYTKDIGFKFWDKELLKNRLYSYLTTDERSNKLYIAYALIYSKNLAKKYSLAELKYMAEDIRSHKYSTQVSEFTSNVVDSHRKHFKTVKLENVIVPVEIAIRNYDKYKQAEQEDTEYISKLKQEYDEALALYNEDFNKYTNEMKKHLIQYHLEERK
jgi:hypothetical protein